MSSFVMLVCFCLQTDVDRNDEDVTDFRQCRERHRTAVLQIALCLLILSQSRLTWILSIFLASALSGKAIRVVMEASMLVLL